MILTHRPRVYLSLVLGALAGCAKSGPSVAPVHGRVTLDGQPLPDAGVVFKASGMGTSGGRTDKDGNYTLIFRRGVMGAPIGMNEVTILEDTQVTHRPQRVPARYNESSTLQHEVNPGDNEINFELTTEEKK